VTGPRLRRATIPQSQQGRSKGRLFCRHSGIGWYFGQAEPAEKQKGAKLNAVIENDIDE
jgi:hypothetical protein